MKRHDLMHIANSRQSQQHNKRRLSLLLLLCGLLLGGASASGLWRGWQYAQAAPAMLKNADASPCAGTSFSAATSYPVGDNPQKITASDFNHDGHLDLATANEFSDNVTVYLCQGNGAFGSRNDFAVGDGPTFVAAGDFNRDGNPDLVTTNRNADKVSVLLGDGLGGFGGRVDYPVGRIPLAVAVGDFNLDGKLDLAVSNGATIASSISILIGNGMGGFSSPTNYPNDTSAFTIVTGDFNRDGKLDLATANLFGSSVSIHLGRGDGTFDPRTDFANGHANEAVATGDFNMDGNPDLVSVAANVQQAFLLPGNGTGRFDTVTGLPLGMEPHNVAVADFNLDGKADLAIEAFFSVAILLGDGMGGFGPVASFSTGGARSIGIVAGDFNGDGKPDLATANSNSNNLSVLLNDCSPNSPPTITAGNVPRTAGSPVVNTTIANVNDAQEPEDALAVTINGGVAATSNGVNVSNLAISPSGDVTADVVAACGTTTATFTLRVTDGGGLFAEATLTVTVNPNTPPTLSYAATTVVAGTAPTINPAAGPSDNGAFGAITLTSVTPNTGLLLNVHPATGVVSVTGASLAGNYNIVVSVTDTCGGTTNAQFIVYVTCPTITLTPATLPGGSANTAYSQTLTASPGGTTYNFSVTSGLLPSGLTLNSNGSFSGAPTQSGIFNFRVTAAGFGSCNGFRDYTLLVSCPAITVNPSSLPGGTVGTAYSQSVSATPAGSYSYNVTGGALPPGLTLNGLTGAITGTPATGGSFTFTVTASSGGGCSGSRGYSVTIACQAVSFTTTSLPAGSAGIAYSQTLTVSPTSGYTFSLVTGSLPGGLMLNSSTGVISGLPTVTGAFTVTIKAQSANGCSATQSYTLGINCPAVSLIPASLPNGATGAAYNQTISATPVGGNYSFAVSGSLPPGLSLNPATGILNGTPTASGMFNFTITATGFGACPGSKAYSIIIGSGGCPAITLPNIATSGAVGSPYNQSVAASPAGGYSYTLTGNVPPSVTFYNTAALLYGYPSASGTYNFTITATDANNCTASKAYSLTIGGAGFSRAVFGDFDGDGKPASPPGVPAKAIGKSSAAVMLW